MAKQSSNNFSLKDHLFNEDRVRFLAGCFARSQPGFDERQFTRRVMKRLTDLELKQRIGLIAETLGQFLAQDFKIASKQILSALPPELDPNRTDDDFGDFIIAPLGEFVVRNGLGDEHVDVSLRTLKEITKRFSMEDSIRHFINRFPERTLREFRKWASDKNYHVRRLVSESTRPRLPWSGRLTIEHTVPLPLLDQLHADSTRYVTRSVANHLNDISKVDPELVLETLRRWQRLGNQTPEELDWICRHALRTLVKQGHRQTMLFLGLRTTPKVVTSAIELASSSINPGQALEFGITITAQRDESLVVDYVIDFIKANGSWSPKVFKAKRLELKRGESIRVRKRHTLRADATTYRLFPGTHRLTIQINGTPGESTEFIVLKS